MKDKIIVICTNHQVINQFETILHRQGFNTKSFIIEASQKTEFSIFKDYFLTQMNPQTHVLLWFTPDFTHHEQIIGQFLLDVKEMSALNKCIWAMIDFPLHFADFFDAGVDYCIDYQHFFSNTFRKHNFLEQILRHKKISESQASVVLEKSVFYDKVANIFSERSTITADTTREVDFLQNILSKLDCKKILDAGCGKGRISIPLALANFPVTGIDISKTLIEKGNKVAQKNNLPDMFFEASLLETGFKNNTFDAVLMMWHVICELLDHQETALRECYRILKRKGLLVIDFPDKTNNPQISDHGLYEDEVSGLGKYRGYVPEIHNFILKLKSLGFDYIEHYKVNWGIPKFVITARKL